MLCIALVTLAVVPFKVEYLIYTVLLIASMLSGYFDDASETAWNEYKKGSSTSSLPWWQVLPT